MKLSKIRTLDPRPDGVDDLVGSIREVGLLNPVTVTPTGQLVCGRRRLEACRRLGWTDIPVVVTRLKGDRLRLAAIDEDVVRKDLTVLQRAELLAERKQLYLTLHPESARGAAGGHARAARRTGSASDIVSFAAQTAGLLGTSRRTVERYLRVVDKIPGELRSSLARSPVANRHLDLLRIADLPVEQQGRVVEAFRSGASGLKAAMAVALARAPARRLSKDSKYDVIVIDPPWSYGSTRTPYPTMSHEELATLPVEEVAAANCVLWLWTTNAMMHEAHQLLEHWGFSPKTILTWIKERSTLGSYLLNTTEHCILAVRGKPQLALTTQTTALHAKNREHSRKPDEFYALVEQLCPGTRKLDMFARQKLRGWAAWGNEVGRFRSAG